MDNEKLKLLAAEGEGLTVEFKEQYTSKIDSGIDRMRDLMRDAGLKIPVFETDNFFRVIFYRNSQYSLKKTDDTVEKTVEKILGLIKANPKITQKELMAGTGLTRRGVEWNLRKLKDDGAIRRVGSDRSGHWDVSGITEN